MIKANLYKVIGVRKSKSKADSRDTLYRDPRTISRHIFAPNLYQAEMTFNQLAKNIDDIEKEYRIIEVKSINLLHENIFFGEEFFG